MIRKLTRQDAKEYKKLRLLALTTDPDVYFASFADEERRDESSMGSEIAAHTDPFGYFGWFDSNNALQAYVQISPAYFAKTKHTGDMYNLYVHPDLRGQGVARELLSILLSKIRQEKKLEILYLSVMQSNETAIALYAALGFEQIGVKKKAVKLSDRYENEVLMQIEL